MKKSILFLLLSALLPTFSQAIDWENVITPNQVYPGKSGQSVIYKLPAELKVDADLSEWKGIYPAPIGTAAYIATISETHQWNGRKDASMDVYMAWTPEGLAFAFDVKDDDVQNDEPPTDLWKKDCIELFLDGRKEPVPGKYGAGGYHLLISPPLGERGSICSTPQGTSGLENVQIAGKLTESGYTVELLLPFSMFPDFKTVDNFQVGISFALDDYDTYDGDTIQPMMMSWNAARELYVYPEKLIRFALKEKPGKDTQQNLDPLIAVAMPWCTFEDAVNFTLTFSNEMMKDTESVAVDIYLRGSEPTDVPKQIHPSFENNSVTIPVNMSAYDEGWFSMKVRPLDKHGNALGNIYREFAFVKGLEDTFSDAEKVLKNAKLSELSQKDPFRAASHMGLLSALEYLRVAMNFQMPARTASTREEIKWRIASLAGATDNLSNAPGLYRLLEVCSDPAGQATVEYLGYNKIKDTLTTTAYLKVNCGSIPLVAANCLYRVNSFEDAKPNKMEKTIFEEGMTFYTRTGTFYERPPEEKSGLLTVLSDNAYYILPDDISAEILASSPDDNAANTETEAFSAFPNCPENLLSALKKASDAFQKPFVPANEIANYKNIIFGGSPGADSPVLEKVKAIRYVTRYQKWPQYRFVTEKDVNVSVSSPSGEASLLVAKRIAKNKPITAEDNKIIFSSCLKGIINAAPESIRSKYLDKNGDVVIPAPQGGRE